ncbi:MAG: stage II sporulation protein M [Chloroflexaceae bacterium]|nr:stage II sporulation protein M [Chloroflexaceae bacterium]
MLAEDFIARKRVSWERLTALLNRAQRGLTGLSAEELQELGRLYRQSTSDLAVARRDFPNHAVSDYLNGLVGRAHGEVYRGRSTRARQVIRFFTHTFPHIFRETWGYTLAGMLMFLLPAMVCYAVAYVQPEAMLLVFPQFEPVLSNIQDGHEWWKSINEDGRAASSSFIMTNNIRVAFLAFAGGMTMGLLTLWVMVQNGILLGSVAGAAHRFDFADNLWGFVAAHGVIELSVIFIAGGAGLQLGWSILRPGLLSRRSALVLAARRAVQLLFGGVILLVIAGLIEGFISPSDELPLFVKLLVSLLSGILLYGYLFLAGRTQPDTEPSMTTKKT